MSLFIVTWGSWVVLHDNILVFSTVDNHLCYILILYVLACLEYSNEISLMSLSNS